MPCDELTPRLAASLDDATVLDRDDHAHLAGCLRCQAEVARERRLRRSLAGLLDVVLVPPDDLLEQIADVLDDDDLRHGRHRRVAWVGGLAAATAAAAGGAIVLAARTRRHRLALAG
jgi:anti-sigma factor RsiW